MKGIRMCAELIGYKYLLTSNMGHSYTKVCLLFPLNFHDP